MAPIPTRALAIEVEEFIDKRVSQIASLLQVVDNAKLVAGEVTKGPRTAAQRLPRHMRRRAMSYNAKRMPTRLRLFAAAYINSKHRSKPPSRFARRRPRNLLLNYIRRQKKDVWLESHVWHAKRFHMISRWGYKLPDRSFQRSFRPIYRAAIRSCAVRDMSYLNCILISASCQQTIIDRLAPLCLAGSGPSFAFKSAQNGQIEATTLVYKPGQQPRGLIGPVRFSWNRVGSSHTISIWVHPTCRDELIEQLVLLLDLTKDDQEMNDDEQIPLSEAEFRVKRMRIDTETYTGADGIKVENLRDQLNRIRLFGPNSIRVVRDVLKLCKSKEAEDYRENHAEWTDHSKCGELMDSYLYTLLVEDPRIIRPPKKFMPKPSSAELEASEDDLGVILRKSAPVKGTLWDRQARIECLRSKMADSELQRKKAEIVGNLPDTLCKIPVQVVIRNGGSGRQTALDGVELIVPAGFGNDWWVACQMRAARASGWRDHLAAHLEGGRMSFPGDVVDSTAGEKECVLLGKEKEAKQLSRPHNRRVQFWSRLSVKHPYFFEWDELNRDWGNTGDAFVLRDRQALLALSNWIGGRGERPDDVINQFPDALVPVRMQMVARGKPARYALICVPTASDLSTLKQVRGGERVSIEQRPRHEQMEEVEMAEDESSEASETEMEKNSSEMDLSGFVCLDPSKGEKLISLKDMFHSDDVIDKSLKRKLMNRKKKVAAKRRKIVLEERLREKNAEEAEKESVSYRHSANREIVGRVVRGDFSFAVSKGNSHGYIAINALKELPQKDRKTYVLIRNATSKYYHPAVVNVMNERVDF